jgi:signal peptide peptidase SppA
MSAGPKRQARRARAQLLAMQWALRPEYLSQMIAIAERRNFDLRAISEEMGEYVDGSWDTTVRDGVAYIPVRGVCGRYMSLFTMICGGTSYELLARDISAAAKDSAVRAIVLDVDSPGGEVNGASDLAQMIVGLRDVKPLVACITGDGCSAAYWLASACERVVAVDTAIVGSIGVVASFLDDSKYMEEQGFREIEIVSSQSPNKRADPATDGGRARIQAIVDALADRFIAAVAEQRGVSADDVLKNFGQGDVFVGEAAVERGLVDAVSTLDELHASLITPPQTAGALLAPRVATTEVTMAPKSSTAAAKPKAEDAPTDPEKKKETADEDDPEKKEEAGAKKAEGEEDDPEKKEEATAITTVAQLEASHPKLVETVRAAERDRVVAIQKLGAKSGQAKIAAECVADLGCTVDAAARKILEGSGASASGHMTHILDSEAALTPPAAKPRSTEESDEGGEAAAAKSIVSLMETHNPRYRNAAKARTN